MKDLFFIKNKRIIQLLIATFIVWVYVEPRFVIHPVTAVLIILFSYLLHSFIEKQILYNDLNAKKIEQENLVKMICRSSQDIITYKDSQGKYLYCNQAFLDIFGYSSEKEILGKSIQDVHTQKDAKILKKISKKVVKGEVIKKIIEVGKNANHYDIYSIPLLLTNNEIGTFTIARNITPEIKLQKALSEKEQMLISILDSMPFAVCLKSLDGSIVYENAKAKDFLGLTDSLTSNRLYYQLNQIDEIKAEDELVCTLRKRMDWDKKITLKSGKIKWFNISKCPILDKENNLSRICCVARDIEVEKCLEEQRETYVATLTHDLKTPTIAQIKALDIILNETTGEINSEQRELLNLTKESCNYMYEMLNTLLNTYKYESGDYVLNYAECNIHELIIQVLKELDTMLKEKNLIVELIPTGEDFVAICDRMQMKRVIVNMLSNAITYAFDGTTIKVYIDKIDKNKSEISVKIENNSLYIKPEVLENIFKKYVTHADKFNKIGFGLGLYLSKQIINAHNGKVLVKSYKDNRNIFGFSLPIENAETENLIYSKNFS